MTTRVLVVGIGADGFAVLPAASQQRVLAAPVLVGGARHLAMVPAAEGQVRRPWPSPLRPGLRSLLAEHPEGLVVLASGDPLLSGVGSTLIDVVGAEDVEIVPAVSSIALARARLGWPAESHATVTLVGRDEHAVLRELAPGRRVLVLSSGPSTPTVVAKLLESAGYGASRLTVLSDLGSPEEAQWSGVASGWAGAAPALHVLALELAGPVVGGWVAGLPDEAFENDGQLTRRDLRAAALARLAPQPGQLLWDVGAGAGSVGIEWMRAHPSCRTIAIEQSGERAARIGRNARALGVPALEVVQAAAPDALAELPTPDAIFVGGAASLPGVLDHCRSALAPGGRLVVHGVTLETEATLAAAYSAHGGELVRLSVERAAPLGGFTGWSPARTVTQWSWSATG